MQESAEKWELATLQCTLIYIYNLLQPITLWKGYYYY